jgi:hypothetical protein
MPSSPSLSRQGFFGENLVYCKIISRQQIGDKIDAEHFLLVCREAILANIVKINLLCQYQCYINVFLLQKWLSGATFRAKTLQIHILLYEFATKLLIGT